MQHFFACLVHHLAKIAMGLFLINVRVALTGYISQVLILVLGVMNLVSLARVLPMQIVVTAIKDIMMIQVYVCSVMFLVLTVLPLTILIVLYVLKNMP